MKTETKTTRTFEEGDVIWDYWGIEVYQRGQGLWYGTFGNMVNDEWVNVQLDGPDVHYITNLRGNHA